MRPDLPRVVGVLRETQSSTGPERGRGRTWTGVVVLSARRRVRRGQTRPRRGRCGPERVDDLNVQGRVSNGGRGSDGDSWSPRRSGRYPCVARTTMDPGDQDLRRRDTVFRHPPGTAAAGTEFPRVTGQSLTAGGWVPRRGSQSRVTPGPPSGWDDTGTGRWRGRHFPSESRNDTTQPDQTRSVF